MAETKDKTSMGIPVKTLLRGDGPTVRMYDDIAKKYAERRTSSEASVLFWDEQCRNFATLLKKSGNSILEVGCGPGVEAKYFIKEGYAVLGLDASEGMLAEARQRVPEGTFMRMDMRDMEELKDGCFSGVWCCASLLHLAKAEAPRAVREFRRVIKDDGTLFISLKKGDGEGMVRSPDGCDRFFAYYQKAEAEKLMCDCGFAVYDSYEFEKFGETWLCIFAVPG